MNIMYDGSQTSNSYLLYIYSKGSRISSKYFCIVHDYLMTGQFRNSVYHHRMIASTSHYFIYSKKILINRIHIFFKEPRCLTTYYLLSANKFKSTSSEQSQENICIVHFCCIAVPLHGNYSTIINNLEFAEEQQRTVIK